MHKLRRSLPDRYEGITKREVKVIKLVSEGLSNLEIAEMMFITKNTLRTHIQSINRKLNISSRSQLVAYGCKFFKGKKLSKKELIKFLRDCVKKTYDNEGLELMACKQIEEIIKRSANG